MRVAMVLGRPDKKRTRTRKVGEDLVGKSFFARSCLVPHMRPLASGPSFLQSALEGPSGPPSGGTAADFVPLHAQDEGEVSPIYAIEGAIQEGRATGNFSPAIYHSSMRWNKMPTPVDGALCQAGMTPNAFALLVLLQRALREKTQITLLGHSTGATYITSFVHLFEASGVGLRSIILCDPSTHFLSVLGPKPYDNFLSDNLRVHGRPRATRTMILMGATAPYRSGVPTVDLRVPQHGRKLEQTANARRPLTWLSSEVVMNMEARHETMIHDKPWDMSALFTARTSRLPLPRKRKGKRK